MTTLLGPGADLHAAVGWAYGTTSYFALFQEPTGLPDEVPIGTEGLLVGALRREGGVGAALAALGATRAALVTAVRRGNGFTLTQPPRAADAAGPATRKPLIPTWTSNDGGDPASSAGLDHLLAELAMRRGLFLPGLFGWPRRRTMLFTAAALRALEAARRQAELADAPAVGCDHLLVGLLTDATSRAVEALAALRINRQAAYEAAAAALRGQVRAPVGDEPDLDLRYTQAVLHGRARYTALGNQWVWDLFSRAGMNWADLPALWAFMDAVAHARRQNHPTVHTGHLLLGILATHEVAHEHPGLLPPHADRLYLGGAVLAESGLTHRRIKQAQAASSHSAARRAGLGEPDADALRAIGIDLDQIVSQAEHAFGPGALTTHGGPGPGRMSDATGVSIATGGTGELLAAILRGGDTGPDPNAWQLLVAAGAHPERIRQLNQHRLTAETPAD